MSLQFKNNFLQGVNMDLDELRLPPDTAIFIKNLTATNININSSAPGLSGSNRYVITPLEGNAALTQSGMPAGTNYTVGFLSAEETNEGYFCVYNSNGNHTIWVIRGDTGVVTKVHQNTLLPFVLDPEFFLGEGRMTFELRSTIDPETEEETDFKFLIFTNNNVFQGVIDVEASIATQSYTTTYFTTTAAFYNRLELIHLSPTLPIKCVKLNDPNEYAPTDEDLTKQNLLINAGWQFRVRTWDVWGRPSEWGIISSVYTPLVGGNCIATSNGLPRCVNLCFDAGNPLVKFIDVAYRRGVGNDPTGQTETSWYITETFRKYDDSTGVPWYQRPYNPIFTTSGSGITFDLAANRITYTFCADKGANPVDPTEAARTQPGIPRWSSSVFAVEKKIGLANNVYDFQPVAQDVIEAIEFDVKLPTPGTAEVPCPAAPLRTITFYANFYNAYQDYSPLLRQTFGVYTFGDGGNATGPGDTSCVSTNFKMAQVFGDQTNPGFIAYLAGTPFKVIGKWGNYDPASGVFTENTIPWSGSFAYPNIRMTQFVIKDVPAGKYVARLASHHAKISDGDLQKTSTTVAGVTEINNCYVPSGRFNGYCANPVKEIVIDCTTGDVNLGGLTDPMFVILDLNQPGNQPQTNAVDGYLYEQKGAAPVEMAPCWMHGNVFGTFGDAFGSFFTDHNGYYFMTSGHAYAAIDIYYDLCDGGGLRNVFTMTSGCGGSTGKMAHGNGDPPRDPDYWGNYGSWKNQVYISGPGKGTVTFPPAARRLVKQKFVTCEDSNIGVPGIPVIMTKCQPTLSGSSGIATIVAHNRVSYATMLATFSLPAPYGSSMVPDYGIAPGNTDLLIFSQKGGCEWNACGDCTTSIANPVVPYLGCGADPVGCGTPTGQVEQVIVRLGLGGMDYAIGDTGTIDGGSPLATYRVLSIGSAGEVTSVVITDPGGGYSTGTTNTTATTGIGTGLRVNITEISPMLRTYCEPQLTVQPNGVGIQGIQDGGKYPVAFWLHDVIGRHTAPQIRGGELGYVFVPNLNDISPSPYPAMALCGLEVTIPTGLTVDPVFTHITFLVGSNCLFSDYFSWAADWVQYVDNTGATNTTNPTSIRIYMGSLLEYSKQNNFKTNIGWDFVTQEPGNPLPNDVVQFLMNGDGTWLDPQKGASITYSKDGLFFTLDYQPELAGLQNGCLFKVVRPKQNNTGVNLPYYEQCLTLDITNGELPDGTWTLPYKDNYLLSRSVPVPLLKGESGPITPGGPATAIQYTSTNQNATLATDGYSTNNVNNNNGVVIFQTVDYQTTFPFFFPSPSPNDLWGSHMRDLGRVGIPNPYEEQKRVGTEICVSLPIADRGIVNGMGTFLSQYREVFDKQMWGNIISVLVETSMCLVICEKDHFVTTFNGSTITTGPNGELIAQNRNGIFTAPARKAGTNYGCAMAQINTIARYAGIVKWLDNTGYVVTHNFGAADSNTDDAGYLSYLLQKIAIVNIANLNTDANGITYWHGKIDPKTMEYFLTVFNIPTDDAPSYLNQLDAPSLPAPETFVFDLKSGIMKSNNVSFTPEYYGFIPGYFLQRQFLSFKNGRPWIHHNNFANNVAPPPYCNFYGTQCNVRITHVVNGVEGKLVPDKVKRFLATEIYCRQSIPGGTGNLPVALFYADVITSEKGQTSRLLVGRWTLKDGYQCAAYLCDINTPPDPNNVPQTTTHAILDGNPLQGRWVKVSFTNNPDWDGAYFELSEKVDTLNFVEKSAG